LCIRVLHTCCAPMSAAKKKKRSFIVLFRFFIFLTGSSDFQR
jgi:hypothetical protein